MTNYLQGISTYNTRDVWPKPANAALLVIDMQEYFLPMASPIIGNVTSLIESCRSKGIKIIYTRHGHNNPGDDGGMLVKWRGEVIEYGTSKWNLIKAINPLDTEPVIDKNRYSAFMGTSLEAILKYRKIEDLIIAGADGPAWNVADVATALGVTSRGAVGSPKIQPPGVVESLLDNFLPH